MAFNIVSSLADVILPMLKTSVDKSSELLTWVSPFILLGITIYIIIHGFEVIRGGGGNNLVLDTMTKIARPVLVFSLALTGGMYASTVVGIFTELRTDLVGLFGSSGDTYANLDASLTSVIKVLSAGVNDSMESLSVMPFNLNGLVMVACLGVIGFCFAIYSIVVALNLFFVDIGLMILFGFGPLFVACFAFQATAKFFDSWLSAVVKYTFTAVLMSLVVGIANSLVARFVASMVASPDLLAMLFNVAAAFIGLGIVIGLVFKTASLAADMVGGVSINLSGAGHVGKAMSMGRGAAGYAGQAAAGAAGTAARYAGTAAAQSPLGVRVLKATEAMRGRSPGTGSVSGAGSTRPIPTAK